MPRETFSVTVVGWQKLGEGLEANAADYLHLDGKRLKLAEMAARANELLVKRDALEAEKRQITRDLNDLLENGRKLANYLRVSVREHYGHDNEKLVEFHLRPHRRRRRRTSTPDEEPAK